MSRKRRNGGRVSPTSHRPRNWGTGSREHQVDEPEMQLLPILVGLSSMLAKDFLPMGSMGVPKFDDFAEVVRAEVLSGNIEYPVSEIVAELFDDEEMRAFVAASNVADPELITPGQLLRSAKVMGAFELVDDGHEVAFLFCGLEMVGGEQFTAAIHAEFLSGVIARNIYVIGQPVAEIIENALVDGVMSVRTTDSSKVGAVMAEAIQRSRRLVPQPESETWIDHQVLVQRIVAKIDDLVPDTSDWEPALDDADLARFIQEFLTSPERASLSINDEGVANALDTIMWFKQGYGTNEPYLWGPQQAINFLTNWVLRKVVGNDSDVLDMVEVLPWLVRWSHSQIDAPVSLTAETLEVIEEAGAYTVEQLVHEPDRLQGIEELVHRMRQQMLDDEGVSAEEWYRQQLVGGDTEFDAEPLPLNEPIDVSNVPEQYRDAVVAVVNLARSGAVELFGEEMGTAVVRLAVHFGEHAPEVLARGKRESAAAAVLGIGASANDQDHFTKKVIGESVGSNGNFGGRANTLCAALGLQYETHWITALGSPAFLIGEMRQRIIDGNV